MTLDKYNNIMYQEDLQLDEQGIETVFRKTFNQYHIDKNNSLSPIREEMDLIEVIINEFDRDDKGQIKEKRKIEKGKMIEKTIFTYNHWGQKTKKEIFKEEGLSELFNYKYNADSLTDPKMIKEIRNFFGSNNYRLEFDYEWSPNGKLRNLRKRYFQEDVLLSDKTTAFYNYVGDMATREVTEGYEAPTKYTDGTVIYDNPSRSTIEVKVNSNGDIVEFTRSGIDLSKKRTSLLKIPSVIYKCQYIYNERKEWTNLILSIWSEENYIITREITYKD